MKGVEVKWLPLSKARYKQLINIFLRRNLLQLNTKSIIHRMG